MPSFFEGGFLKGLDAFGFHYVFNFEGQLKYRSNLGGILTITCFLYCLSIIYVLAQEIFYRNNPTNLTTRFNIYLLIIHFPLKNLS